MGSRFFISVRIIIKTAHSSQTKHINIALKKTKPFNLNDRH
ncbi:hypothetical protein ENTCAN_05695 [Enterobacter cancerogenus ATCC 35316]|nr:hypothetical protein ENTCAN_05695 [Enterobacter cancerogenus ATCC 35316]